MSTISENPLSQVERESRQLTKRKFDPKIGMIGLTWEQQGLFEDCFQQFRIQTLFISGAIGLQLRQEKFDGIVLAVGGNAAEVLQTARTSSSNRRLLFFAVCKSRKDVLPYTQYGINATLEEPLDRQAVLKLVKATYPLILNEFRKYIRIPIVLEVQVGTEVTTHTGSSCELSAGGMSLAIPSARLQVGNACSLTFSLPALATVHMNASVCWIRESGHTLGVNFSAGQEGCHQVKKWLDEYLGIK